MLISCFVEQDDSDGRESKPSHKKKDGKKKKDKKEHKKDKDPERARAKVCFVQTSSLWCALFLLFSLHIVIQLHCRLHRHDTHLCFAFVATWL